MFAVHFENGYVNALFMIFMRDFIGDSGEKLVQHDVCNLCVWNKSDS